MILSLTRSCTRVKAQDEKLSTRYQPLSALQ